MNDDLVADNDDETLLPVEGDEEVFLSDDNFEAVVRTPRVPWDDEELVPGESTYPDADRGPEPIPDWVITSADAMDTELGTLKSGKEADVFIVERRHLEQVNLLAAKRYVPVNRRNFRSKGMYQQGRRMRDTRAQRAADRKTSFGSKVGAAAWALHEMDVLAELWMAGVAVPYPVQLLGTELMLEYIGDEEEAAPRLVDAQVSKAEAPELFDQALELLRGLARVGYAHGDLSPYNLLVWEDRLVMIDLPQAAALALNPNALDLFKRDVANLCSWFGRKGVKSDVESIFSDCMRELTE